MKRKRSRNLKRSGKLKRSRKCPYCSRRFRGGDAVVKTVYAAGNPDLALSQEGAKASLAAMNSMMR